MGDDDALEAALEAEQRWREASRSRSDAQGAGNTAAEQAAVAEMEEAAGILDQLEPQLQQTELPAEIESLRKFRLALTPSEPVELDPPIVAMPREPNVESTIPQSNTKSAAVLAFLLGLVVGVAITVLLYRWYLSDKVIVQFNL